MNIYIYIHILKLKWEYMIGNGKTLEALGKLIFYYTFQ